MIAETEKMSSSEEFIKRIKDYAAYLEKEKQSNNLDNIIASVKQQSSPLSQRENEQEEARTQASVKVEEEQHKQEEVTQKEIEIEETIELSVPPSDGEGLAELESLSFSQIEPALDSSNAGVAKSLLEGVSSFKSSRFSVPIADMEKKDYRLNELLDYHGDTFIKRAYLALLKRNPDKKGFCHYQERLKQGKFSKVLILAALKFSKEGRSKKVKVKGLFIPLFIELLCKIPLLGVFIRWLITLFTMPMIVQSLHRLEGHVALHMEESHSELNEVADEIYQSLLKIDNNYTKESNQIRGLIGEKAELSWLQKVLSDKNERDNAVLKSLVEHIKKQNIQAAELAQNVKTKIEQEYCHIERCNQRIADKVDKTALAEQLNDKAGLNEIEQLKHLLEQKVTFSHFEQVVADMARKAEVEGKLADKADLNYVKEELINKIDESVLEQRLVDKADLKAVERDIAGKVDFNQLKQLETQVERKVDEICLTMSDLQENKLGDINKRIAEKADIDDIAKVEQKLHLKVDHSMVEYFNRSLEQKADNTRVDQLAGDILEKASNTSVEKVLQRLENKVSFGAFEILSEKVDSKASAQMANNMAAQIAEKADMNLVVGLKQQYEKLDKEKWSEITEWLQNHNGQIEELRTWSHLNGDSIESVSTEIKQNTQRYQELFDEVSEQMADKAYVMDVVKKVASEEFELVKNQIFEQLSNAADKQEMMALLNQLQSEVQKISPQPPMDLDRLYVAFEDKFRGSREEIKARQSVYVPLAQEVYEFTGGAPALDVGCGRGEWLELMKEHNIEANGVELNKVMVERCEELELNVVENDVITYLKGLESDSLSLITGFHIIEHLPFEVLIQLYDESLRVLKKGGKVIFETPNPENTLVGSYYFYADPTHINPIVPFSMGFILEHRGFKDVEIKRLHKYSDYFEVKETDDFKDTHFFNEMDFSLIGVKP